MLGQMLNFDKMITPTIIKIIFWIGILQAFGLGLATIISGFGAAAAASSEHSPMGVLFGLLGLIGGVIVFALSVLLTRVFCELMILSFRIYETLVQIRDRATAQGQSVAGYYPPQAASV
jgi:hypothetical protein